MITKSLVNLVSDIAKLESALIESNGEITPEIEALISTQDIDLPEKLDQYALMIDRMESIERFYLAKAQTFQDLAAAASTVGDRCLENLRTAMRALNRTEISGFDVRFQLVKSNPKCIIDDENQVPSEYKREVTEVKIDKKKILEDLKLGVPVEGARLEPSQSLRRYVNPPTRKVDQSE